MLPRVRAGAIGALFVRLSLAGMLRYPSDLAPFAQLDSYDVASRSLVDSCVQAKP